MKTPSQPGYFKCGRIGPVIAERNNDDLMLAISGRLIRYSSQMFSPVVSKFDNH